MGHRKVLGGKKAMLDNKTGNGLISLLALLCLLATASTELSAGPAIAAAAPGDTSLSDVKQKGKLVIGSDVPYGVMEFYDDAGKLAGIDIDIAREIASELGVSLEVENIPFNQLFVSLDSGKVDAVISAVTITLERQEKMLFSAPYLDAGMSIAVRRDNTQINSADDLKGKRIGVLKGTIGEDLMAKSDDVDPSLVRSYEKNDARIQDLLDGKLDAIIVHFLVKEHSSIKIVGRPLSQSFYGVVTRLKSEALMSEVNRVLREMKRSGNLQDIRRRYVR
jgi:polar amino acid transport system substrate-binding protein